MSTLLVKAFSLCTDVVRLNRVRICIHIERPLYLCLCTQVTKDEVNKLFNILCKYLHKQKRRKEKRRKERKGRYYSLVVSFLPSHSSLRSLSFLLPAIYLYICCCFLFFLDYYSYIGIILESLLLRLIIKLKLL